MGAELVAAVDQGELGRDRREESLEDEDDGAGDGQAPERLPVDAVLVNIGFSNTLGPIRHWGLDIEGSSIKVDGMMQTSRSGVFAAGDIATNPGKLKLIATGFGEACVAVNYAKHYLDPSANIFPGHSSNMK